LTAASSARAVALDGNSREIRDRPEQSPWFRFHRPGMGEGEDTEDGVRAIPRDDQWQVAP
jgi:hypothetical protein